MSNIDKNLNKKGLGRGLNSLFGDVVSPLPSPTISETGIPRPAATVFNPPTIVIKKPKISEDFIEPARVVQVNTEVEMSSKTEVITSVDTPDEQRIHLLAIEKIQPNPDQPRTHFDPEKLKELADSIKTQGIIQPILVRRKESGFEIIAGERRWRAAQIAGLHEVPAIIKYSDDKRTLEWALIENIQRADLNPIEEAEAYQELIKRFGMSHAEVADRVGKDRVTITNILRLLQFDESIREKIGMGELSTGHAKVLLTIPSRELQAQWAEEVVLRKLSVRALEKLLILKKGLGPQEISLKESEPTAATTGVLKWSVDAASKELEGIFGTKVQIDYRAGQGQIRLSFYSDEQFNQVMDKVRATCQK